MNQTENNEQTTQQNKTIWKLAVAAFIFAAMFFGANALAGQNVLLNIVCALVLAGAAVFCGAGGLILMFYDEKKINCVINGKA